MSNPDFKCVFCGSSVQPATTRLLPAGNDAPIFIFTGVPCEKCVNCGHEYFHPATTRKLLEQTQASLGTIRSQHVQPTNAKIIAFQS